MEAILVYGFIGFVITVVVLAIVLVIMNEIRLSKQEKKSDENKH